MKVPERIRRIALHPLPWILLLALALRGPAAGYLRSSDDLDYAQGARNLMAGRHDPGSFHQLRLGMTVPVAACFAVFGVRPGASVLWPLASSLLSIAVLFFLAERRSSRPVAALAALFLAVSTQHVLSGAELFPDAPLTLWILLALHLYLAEREGAGRPAMYALAGLCLYAALATRIEALKILLVFAFFEAAFLRRRPFDRKIFWVAAGLAIPLALEMAYFGIRTGHPLERLRELSAAREWADNPGARNMGLWMMVKSIASPFGAFGLLFLPAAAGTARAIRERRLGIVLVLTVFLFGSAFAIAVLYRLADGRYYALVCPWMAWLAAEGVAALPRRGLRIAAAAALALAGVLLVHVRMPPDTVRAYSELAQALDGSPDPLFADPRTVEAMEFYFPGHRAAWFWNRRLAPPCWLVDHQRFRAIDRSLYDNDRYPGDAGTLVRTIPLTYRGLPGFMPLARALFGWRGAGAVETIRVFRIER